MQGRTFSHGKLIKCSLYRLSGGKQWERIEYVEINLIIKIFLSGANAGVYGDEHHGLWMKQEKMEADGGWEEPFAFAQV